MRLDHTDADMLQRSATRSRVEDPSGPTEPAWRRSAATELAAVAGLTAIIIGALLPTGPASERVAMGVVGALGLTFTAVWFHAIPRAWFGRYRHTIALAIFQMFGAALVLVTGGIPSAWFVFYLLPVFVSVFLASVDGTVTVSGVGFAGLATIAIVTNAIRTPDLLVTRFIELAGAAFIAVLLTRAVAHEHGRAEAALARLEREATRDELTGLLNRRGFQRDLDPLERQAIRTGQVYSVLVMDVDHLKRINDQHGHAIGDRVLIAVADAIRQEVRGYDIAARTGGDEFVILFREGRLDAASQAGHRIGWRLSASGLARELNGLGVSFGLAERSRKSSASDAFERADADMYARKRERDRAVG